MPQSHYACRDADCSLRIPPAGKTRRSFCPDCSAGPYKGARCLFGHCLEDVHGRLLERQEDLQKDRAGRLYRKCALCGYPVFSKDAAMHRGCTNRVRWRVGFHAKRGEVITVAQAIEELHENGKDLPPA